MLSASAYGSSDPNGFVFNLSEGRNMVQKKMFEVIRPSRGVVLLVTYHLSLRKKQSLCSLPCGPTPSLFSKKQVNLSTNKRSQLKHLKLHIPELLLMVQKS